MAYSKQWLDFQEAENNFFRIRTLFEQDGKQMISDLHTALSRVDDRETALRFLEDVRVDYNLFSLILPQVLDLAIDSGNLTVIELCRNIILHYKDNVLFRADLSKHINNYLKNEDDWHYRRIAEIFYSLYYENELENLVSICKSSDNIDIKSIGEDFSS